MSNLLDDPWRLGWAALDIGSSTALGPCALARLQGQRLRALLSSTWARSRWYRSHWGGTDAPEALSPRLRATTKRELMAHFSDWVTDPALRLDALRDFVADPSLAGEPFEGRYVVWESSGTSGVPGLFVQDAQAMAVYDALEALRRRWPRPGRAAFDPWGFAQRVAFVGAVDGHFASHVTMQRLRRRAPWLASHWASISLLQPLPALRQALADLQPNIVATYPTAAALLAAEQRAGRLSLSLDEVWTGGETLGASVRAEVAQAFGCPLRNSYGASEFLPIAWECDQAALHVNADWVILEPVDEHGRPAPAGQWSHSTWLTNLANHVQPLVRLDLGDRVRWHPERCRCGCALPVIEVAGRRDDVLILPGADGRPVSLLPLALSTVLEDEAGIYDFLLQQTGPSRMRLDVAGMEAAMARGSRGREVAAVVDAFAQRLGAAPLSVTVRGVAQLPGTLRGRSGKLRRIVGLPPDAAQPRASAAPKRRSR